jgi:CheY-like chemotaxis protein
VSDMICPVCNTSQRAPGDGQSPAGRCVQCKSLVFSPTGGPRVLIAHNSDALAIYVGMVLFKAGFSPLRGQSGAQALRLLTRHRPPAAVIDVALEDLTVFQLIEHVRSSEKLCDTKVVLLASVYRPAAYKRKPTSLYGAHDYVEQHHVPDLLPSKLCALLDIDPSGVAALAEESRLEAERASGRHDLSGAARIHALAHNIVADVALYYQTDVEKAAATGDLTSLSSVLCEARQVLAGLVDEREFAGSDPIKDAFIQLIARMQKAGANG